MSLNPLKCSARNERGKQCLSSPVVRFEKLCKHHHESKYSDDPEYKARYDEHIDYARQQHNNRVDTSEQALVTADEEGQRRIIRTREEKRAFKEKTIANLEKADKFIRALYGGYLVSLWEKERIGGMDCPKAYAVLKYRPVTPETNTHMIQLVRAVMAVYLLAHGYHPEFSNYADVPQDQRTEALDALRVALVPFGEIDVLSLIPEDDLYSKYIRPPQEESPSETVATTD